MPETMTRHPFAVCGRTAILYATAEVGRPLLVLHAALGDGSDVLREWQALGTPAANLLVISSLDWQHDMSPWPAPPLRAKEAPFGGGAEAWLETLTGQLLPRACALLPGQPPAIGIVGYSLAGLFALYALHRSDCFDRAASVSGSLWYPGFVDFVATQPLPRPPARLYLSLGDREAKTRHPLMGTVADATAAVCAHYREQGLNVRFAWQAGNHFTDVARRTAKGLAALL